MHIRDTVTHLRSLRQSSVDVNTPVYLLKTRGVGARGYSERRCEKSHEVRALHVRMERQVPEWQNIIIKHRILLR